MTYEQLVDEMGALLDDLEGLFDEIQSDRNVVNENLNNTKILLNPATIWQNTLEGLQEVMNVYGGKDA